MKNNVISTAVVGVGYWGPNYARILTDMNGVRLSHFCDTDKIALSSIKRKYPFIKTTTHLGDILSDGSIDSVAVVTPPDTHFAIVKKCLEAGKHVLVEKPFVLSSREARELTKLAKAHKRILSVDHTYLFNSGVQRLKREIHDPGFGEIYYLYGLYNALGPVRREVSALWDLSIHFLYVANYLLDMYPTQVIATGGDYLQKGIADVAFCWFRYPKRVLVSLHSSWLDPNKTRELVVVGTKKMAVFDDISREAKLRIFDKHAKISANLDFTNFSVALFEGDVYIPRLDNQEPLRECIANFIDACVGRGESQVNGKQAHDVIAMLEAAQLSMEKNGKSIPIHL